MQIFDISKKKQKNKKKSVKALRYQRIYSHSAEGHKSVSSAKNKKKE